MIEAKSLDDQISNYLTMIVCKVKYENVMGNYDINKYMQLVFADILNIIYGYNLQDMDKKGIYFRGIDIADKKNKICYQVTTDNSIDKIRDSLEKYNINEYYNQYPNVNILIIGEKKSILRKLKIMIISSFL